MGLWLSRSMIIILGSLFPVMGLLMFLDYGLIAIGIDATVASYSGLFVKLLLPGLIPFAICRCLARFLIAMNIRLPNSIIPVISIFVNFVLNWLFVFGIGFEGFGFAGAAIATTLSRFFALLCYIYVLYHNREKIKEPLSGFVMWKEVFKLGGFFEFLKLSIPGTSMYCFCVV